MTRVMIEKALVESAIKSLEFFASEMTVGQRYTNQGQDALYLPGEFRAALAEPAVEPDSSIKVWVLVDKDGNPQKWRTPCFVGPESDTQLECFNRAQPDRAPHKSVMLAAPPPAEVPLLTHGEIEAAKVPKFDWTHCLKVTK